MLTGDRLEAVERTTAMRFTLEQRHLTDERGKPLSLPEKVQFFTFEAKDPNEALQLFVRDHDAEMVGDVLTFPGFQAIATMRNTTGVFTLQVGPSTDRLKIR